MLSELGEGMLDLNQPSQLSAVRAVDVVCVHCNACDYRAA